MAGCDKAGRTRNRPSQKAYVAVKRAEINKKKKTARHLNAIANRKAPKVPRGTARALRRMHEGISQETPLILQ